MSADTRIPAGSYATRPGNRTEPSMIPAPHMDGHGSNAARAGRSVPQLIRELSTEGADLVRQEVALAKAEMSEKLEVFQRSMISIALGGAVLLAALLTALWAVNRGLTALLAQAMDIEIAIWLSPLILTVVLAAIGWGMVQKGKSAIRDEGLDPRKTKASLRANKVWARAKAHEMKEDIKHG